MTRVLIRCFTCLMLAMLPLIIFESMWSSPEWRDLARKSDRDMPWIVLPGYYLGILVFWLWWMNRPWPGDELLPRELENGSRTVGKSGDDGDLPSD